MKQVFIEKGRPTDDEIGMLRNRIDVLNDEIAQMKNELDEKLRESRMLYDEYFKKIDGNY